MFFVYGTALVVAAVLALGFARFAVTRFEQTSWFRRIAATEVMALSITTTLAFGLACLGAGIAGDSSALGMTEMAASLGVIALSIVAVVRIFRTSRTKTAATAAPTGKSPAAA